MENRLGLIGKSKVAAKAEAVRVFSKSLEICFQQKKDTFPLSLFVQVKEQWAEFSPLMAAELEKQSVKREFEHKVGNTFLVDLIASFVLLFEEAV